MSSSPAAKPAQDNATNSMWGGRFAEAPAELMIKINASIDIDQRMYREDIRASQAHAKMLAKVGILTAAESQTLVDGLAKVLAEIEAGQLTFKVELEDIHMNVESRLKELVGEVAGKLHTARSRNDQVVTDFRLWLRGAIEKLDDKLAALQEVLNGQAQVYHNAAMPGFTHLQVAQPVTFGLHLGAYAQMFGRDRSRLQDCSNRLNECPLGACALAGTSFPIDRAMTAAELGFKQPMANTMDAVGARDFVLEFLAACSIAAVHLSRLAEEIILWTSQPFGFIRLADSYTTGSSIMPQKRNADAAELVRGKSGQITGTLMQMLMIMKGLPMTYNKDMQDDKAATFSAFDTLSLCVDAMGGMLATMTVQQERMRAVADAGFATATELADWLVQNLGLPFREAHHVTGRIVKLAETKGLKLDELALADMQAVEPRITDDIYNVLKVEAALKRRGLVG
jgi:argininosuccinate lyase